MSDNMPGKIKQLHQAFRRFPLYQRLLTYAMTAYLLYAALLGLLVPYLIEDQAPPRIGELLGRTVELDDVSINPFTLNIELTNLRILEPDNRPFTGFDQLQVQFNLWQSLFNRKIGVEDVTLTKPFSNIVRLDENNFNFSDITERLAAKKGNVSATEETTPASEKTALPHITFNKLAIKNTTFSFNDHVTGAVLSYPDISLVLTHFDSLAGLTGSDDPDTNQYQVRITGLDASKLATQGAFQLEPLQVTGKLQLDSIQLTTFWPFAADLVSAKLNQGAINFSTDYELLTANNKLQFISQQGLFSLKDLQFNHDNKPLITLPLFKVNGITLDLQKQQVDIADISSEGLQVQAAIDEKGVNLVSLFTPPIAPAIAEQTNIADANATTDPLSSKSESSPTDAVQIENPEPVSGWVVNLNHFALQDVDINVIESLVTDSTPWRIYPINLSTGAISSTMTAPINYKLDLAINQQGTFSSTGDLDVKQQAINAEIILSDLLLAQFQPYLTPYVNLSLAQGSFSTQGKVHADAGGQLTYQGMLSLNELLIKDNKFRKPLLKWQNVTVDQLKFDNKARCLVIGNLALTQPYGQFIIAEDKTTNASNLAVSPKNSATTSFDIDAKIDSDVKSSQTTPAGSNDSEISGSTPLQIEIAQINISDGAADFSDNSLQPQFSTSVHELEGRIGKLSSTSDQNAPVDIKGMINHYAPITLKGEINPLKENPYVDVEFALQHFELPSVTPYSDAYAGYNVADGQLSLALKYKLENNYLKGKNQIVLKQLDMNKSESNDSVSILPISLAIPLLKDNNGVIDLGINVSGDINNPSFNVADVIVNSITDLVMKAATSPLSLLASLAGSDEDLNVVNFAAGDNQLTANEQKKMAILGTALNDKPALKLSIEGAYHGQYDEQALADTMLNEKLAELSHTELDSGFNAAVLPETGPVINALIQVYEQEFKRDATQLKAKIAEKNKLALNSAELLKRWHKALYQQSSAVQNVKLEQLAALAKARAKAVQVYLVKEQQVKADRILLISSKERAPTHSTQALITLVTQQ